jgi:DNA-binding MarR family transcriptional regulator
VCNKERGTSMKRIPTACAPGQVRPVPQAHVRILMSLRRISRALDLYSRKLRGTCNLTAPQLVCLLSLAEHGPSTASAVSDRVHLSRSTLVGILDRLEEQGFIVRERSRSDRRQVYLDLTERGREVAQSAPSPLQDKLARALGALDDAGREALARSLEQVVDMMEAGEAEASAPDE